MDWKTLIQDVVAAMPDRKDSLLEFQPPATDAALNRIKDQTGIEVTGPLAELLKQTDGIRNNRFGDSVVWSCSEIIEYHQEHKDFLRVIDVDAEQAPRYLFFADNGCGEHFGFPAESSQISSEQIGVYYPTENEFHIVASDLTSWVQLWLGGTLET